MLAAALTSFTTFFATIGPIEAAVIFATLTPGMAYPERRRIALRATLIASTILAGSTLAGGPLLRQLGVGIPALQTAGGIILLVIALDMVFARPTSAFKLTPSEGAEAQRKDDLAVFPLATPLLAGPGAMSAGILLAANAHGDPLELAVTVAVLAAVMGMTLALLLAAHELTRFLGVTAQRVLMRVFGILLAAIAVQALFNGIGASGLVGLPR
ncbi:MAG: MarC family protein [Hyphomicrobium sp.]|uniref:MarC family protein n=1 Tax=Hyphomicrobium sp. TaxID=82 RepID=UPI003D143C58